MIARVRNTANMAISSFNYLLLKQVMCHVTPGFPANPLPAVPIVLGREFGSRALGSNSRQRSPFSFRERPRKQGKGRRLRIGGAFYQRYIRITQASAWQPRTTSQFGAKLGFFKGLWVALFAAKKFIIIGIIALVVAIKKFFGKGKNVTES